MSDPRLSFASAVTLPNAEVRDRLNGTVVRIEVTPGALVTLPGQVLTYQLATLTARLFDHVVLEGDDAVRVHAGIRLLTGAFLPSLRELLPTLRPTSAEEPSGQFIRMQVGDDDSSSSPQDLFVGAVNWVAMLSTSEPRPVREGTNPCGALAAGALAAAEVFKLAFDGRMTGALRATEINLSLLSYAASEEGRFVDQPELPDRIAIDAVLAGCGSVGCAFLLGALLTPGLEGRLATVDNGVFDSRNPYKYSLLDWSAAKRAAVKAEWAALQVTTLAAGAITATPFVGTAAEYVASLPETYRLPIVVAAVDTREARLEIQDMLPERIVNAGIAGTVVEVSSHGFGEGACLGCVIMQQEMESWSAEPIATRTGLSAARVDELIKTNAGLTKEDTDRMIIAGKISMESAGELEDYEGQPLLSFVNRLPYADTLINSSGGIAVARVTTAFVSAFAGVLLLAEFLKASVPALEQYRVENSYRQDLIGIPAEGRFRYDRDPHRWCACHSPFRLQVFREKYAG